MKRWFKNPKQWSRKDLHLTCLTKISELESQKLNLMLELCNLKASIDKIEQDSTSKSPTFLMQTLTSHRILESAKRGELAAIDCQINWIRSFVDNII